MFRPSTPPSPGIPRREGRPGSPGHWWLVSQLPRTHQHTHTHTRTHTHAHKLYGKQKTKTTRSPYLQTNTTRPCTRLRTSAPGVIQRQTSARHANTTVTDTTHFLSTLERLGARTPWHSSGFLPHVWQECITHPQPRPTRHLSCRLWRDWVHEPRGILPGSSHTYGKKASLPTRHPCQ